MSKGVQVSTTNGVSVITLDERYKSINETEIPALQTTVLEAVDSADPPHVVFDLKNVEFFGSSFIEILFRMWNRLNQKSNGRFAICGLTEYCLEVIQVTNLDKLWQLCDTVEQAVDQLSSDN